MSENKEQNLKLFNRELLELSGVIEVIDFDESKVRLETKLGDLIINGLDLKMQHLDLDDGELIIKGEVAEFKYDQVSKAEGFLKRLFK
ncbi:MAG: sporulation protein YabP [Bacillota bacterium]